jgi:hypothetical protein
MKLDSGNRDQYEAGDEKSERAEAMGGWKVIGIPITGKR